MGPIMGPKGGRTGRRIWAMTVACGAAESRARRMRIDFIFAWDRAVRKPRTEGLDELVDLRYEKGMAGTGTYF